MKQEVKGKVIAALIKKAETAINTIERLKTRSDFTDADSEMLYAISCNFERAAKMASIWGKC